MYSNLLDILALALPIDHMPSLAPGSYINITTPNQHQQNNSPPENTFEPIGDITPPQDHEVVPISDMPPTQQQQSNTQSSHSRENVASINSNNGANPAEPQRSPSPTSGITSLLSPTTTTSPSLPGMNMEPKNNNVLKTSDLNGFIPTTPKEPSLGDIYKDVIQTTGHITSDIKQKPPALDLSTNQQIFPQRYVNSPTPI